jgi:hypothetical protein
MIQIAICIDDSAKEVERQTNAFFNTNKDRIKYVDIKYHVRENGNHYAMIIYDLIEEDSNTLKL